MQGGPNVVWKRPGLLIPIVAADQMLADVKGTLRVKYICFVLQYLRNLQKGIDAVLTASVERDRQLIGSNLIAFEIADLIASSSHIVLPKAIVTEIYNKTESEEKMVCTPVYDFCGLISNCSIYLLG